jgi:hypothetical protein
LLTLGGVMGAPRDWNISYVEETLGADVQNEFDRAIGLLYGRTTFEGMAAAWPMWTGPTADRSTPRSEFTVRAVEVN